MSAHEALSCIWSLRAAPTEFEPGGDQVRINGAVRGGEQTLPWSRLSAGRVISSVGLADLREKNGSCGSASLHRGRHYCLLPGEMIKAGSLEAEMGGIQLRSRR